MDLKPGDKVRVNDKIGAWFKELVGVTGTVAAIHERIPHCPILVRFNKPIEYEIGQFATMGRFAPDELDLVEEVAESVQNR